MRAIIQRSDRRPVGVLRCAVPATVRFGLVAEWRVCEDTTTNRAALGL